MTLPAMCVEHSGADPVHRGAPHKSEIKLILLLCKTDKGGRRYFYDKHQSLRQLKMQQDFKELNELFKSYGFVSGKIE